MQKQEAVQTQITSLRRDIKKLQTDAMAPPPEILAQAAVHTENFITSVQSDFISFISRCIILTYMKVDGECLDSSAPCFMVLGLW